MRPGGRGSAKELVVAAIQSHVTFESTLPTGEPELMRVSAFRRYLDELERDRGEAGASRLSSLSPSLLVDLKRFESDGRQTELLEVLAACLRHARPLAIHLQCGARVVPLTVFPYERLVHCPLPMHELLAGRLADLQVMQVEPALLRPPGDAEQALVGRLNQYAPYAPLAWALALRGSREELLPEIAGSAAYRVPPGAPLRGLALAGSLQAAVQRLQRETTNLREMAEWPGFDRTRAMRLLNALYLQAALIVSRSHPAANGDSWFGTTR
jgi:hypothetical protein